MSYYIIKNKYIKIINFIFKIIFCIWLEIFLEIQISFYKIVWEEKNKIKWQKQEKKKKEDYN